MRVLVACEFSGTVRNAFAALGHDAWSCDLLPSETPGNHYQGDVRELILPTLAAKSWDLMIAHPHCTYLTSSAEWAYKDPDFERYPNVGYHQRLKPGTLFGAARRGARENAVDFFLLLWNCGIDRVCIENPVGHMAQRLRGVCRQTVQPNQFGHDASKSTCLFLKNLPKLMPTKNIQFQDEFLSGEVNRTNEQGKPRPSSKRLSLFVKKSLVRQTFFIPKTNPCHLRDCD
jgi:hypothetical protein